MADDVKHVSDQYPELYHYTSVPAFEKIYKSRTFWATHYQDLNDSSELRRFRLKVSEFIAPDIRNVFDKRMQRNTQLADEVDRHGGIDTVVEQEAANQVEVLHRETFGERTFRETFICSFCAHSVQSDEATHGILSQWRGYGTDGGVAIVLDTHGIEERMEHEKTIFAHPMNHIGDVKYDTDDVGIQKAFCKVFELLPGILNTFYADQEPPYDRIFDHFVHGSTLVKHRGFHEEKEVRIVVSPRPTSPDSIFYDRAHDSKPTKVIRYRRKGDIEVRYIELFGEAPLPIERVIVGPSRIQNLNYQRISALVTGSKPKIGVVKSETPFIG
jgi:hypothetical protein